MLASSRTVRLLASLVVVVVLALPFAASTPWAKALVFERATEWADERLGIRIEAARLDYRLPSLTLSAEDVTLTRATSPGQPLARIGHLDIELAPSALRGRLDFRGIRARDVRLVLDATTLQPRADATDRPPSGRPSFRIDQVNVENLDLTLRDEDVGLEVRDVTAALSGHGRRDTLSGTITAAGGLEVSFDTDAVRIAFDRAEARVELHDPSAVRAWASASSAVGEVRAEGSVPLAADGPLDLSYDGAVLLERFSDWWSDAPQWRGRTTVSGTVTGPLRSPAAAFHVIGHDLAWSALDATSLDATGAVSAQGLNLESISVTTRQASLSAGGTLAFRRTNRTEFAGRWTNVGVSDAARWLGRGLSPAPSVTTAGTATVQWQGLRPSLDTIEARVEAISRVGAGATTTGSVEATAQQGRWHVDYRQALDGGTTAQLRGEVAVNTDQIGRSGITGSITVQALDIGPALAQLVQAGVVPPLGVPVTSRAVAFNGSVSGTLSAPAATGTVDADDLAAAAARDLRLQGTVAFDTHALSLTHVRVDAGANYGTVEGTLPWRREPAAGTFTAHVEDAGPLAPTLPEVWIPRGVIDVSGEWRGILPALEARANVNGTGIAVNGISFDTLTADASFVERRLVVDSLRAAQPAGSLTGEAAWDFAAGTLRADVIGTTLDVTVLAPARERATETRARVEDASLEAHVSGPLNRLDGTIDLAAASVELDGRPTGSISGTATLHSGRAVVKASAPTLGATLDGTLVSDHSWPFEGRVTLSRADVAALARLAGADEAVLADVHASVDATLEASGRASELGATQATVLLTNADGTLRGQPVRVVENGRVQIADGRARVLTPMRLEWGSTMVRLADSAESAQPGMTVTLESSLAELVTLAPDALPPDLSAEGTMRAELLLSDRVADLRPTGDINVELRSLRQGATEIARNLTVRAGIDPALVRIRSLQGVVLDGTVDAEGSAPVAWLWSTEGAAAGPGAGTATFRVTSSVVLGSAVAFLRQGSSQVSGTIGLTLTGTATAPRLDAVQATLRGEGGTISAGAFSLKPEGGTTVRLEDGRVHLDGFRWKGPDSELNATGALGIVAGVDGTLHLNGDASLGLLTLFMPARVDGRARFDVDVSGPPGARDFRGTVDVADGTVVVPEWRLSMADWSGTVVVDENGIEARQVRGQLNGGEATVDGRIPVRPGGTADTMRLALRNAFLDVPRGFRSQLDANLEWSRGTAGGRLSGTATVTARTYREPVTEIARLASGLIDESAPRTSALPAALAGTVLDVHLTTVGPLAITNSVASVALTPDLQLTGTFGQPVLRGQVAVADDGRIQFSGRQYRLRDSRLEFSPEQGLMPRLAVSGETRVGEYTVFLRLSGPATEINTALSSDPPLGERDLQTLLVTGQREEFGRGSSSDQNAVGAVSGDVLGLAGQFLGFDSVVVGTTDDLSLMSSDVDPALRLTVSKRLGRRFELVLSDNLDDNELTWVIIYRPRPGFELRAISRDNTEYTAEFRQEIFFGPGVSPPRAAATRRAPRDRVGAVTVTGAPGFPTEEVLSVTSLGVGDRFEFGRWLDDRDRVARLYRDRGYFAARIVPTRQEVAAADGTRQVSLTYRIARGPSTSLTVQGYQTTTSLVERLEQAWTDSVLIELLDADLERVMREHLVNAGHLRATVTVAVDRSATDRIAATITVEPGPLTTERRTVFSGNRAIDSRTLLSEAAAQNVLTPAWLDPATLLAWVESTYVARGYLAVKATVRPVEYDAGLATLPVAIVEGPLARVTALTVAGTSRVSDAEALKATGLQVGSPYLAGSEQLARQALERYYRNQGYRDVKVTARSTASADDGSVALSLSLVEGPQYVVRAVRTSGVESTRDGLVDRATQIEPGSPASPATAEAARRRLYDIGTFRSADVTFEPAGAAAGDTIPVDAVVALQESRRFLFLYGLETTNQYQSLFDQRVTTGGVAADLRDRNFLGRGWTLGAGLRYEPSFESARVLMAIPRLRSTRIRTNIYADTRSEERARTEAVIFRDDENTLTIEQRWRVRRSIEVSWGYHYEYRNLRFISADGNTDLLDFTGFLAGPAGAVVFDHRDNLFDAKRGWLASATVDWGLRPLGSDFDYLRMVARASHYLPVGPLTLASNVRWGNLAPFKGQPPITVLDIFFTAGGTQTVRGFKQDSLSAYYLDPNGLRVPVGGSKLLVFNEELRFPLFGLFSGAGFVDAGNTFTNEKGIVLGDLAVGAGFGLRIRTPLAPIRIDLGFPVRSNTGQTSIRWHFSIGQIF